MFGKGINKMNPAHYTKEELLHIINNICMLKRQFTITDEEMLQTIANGLQYKLIIVKSKFPKVYKLKQI